MSADAIARRREYLTREIDATPTYQYRRALEDRPESLECALRYEKKKHEWPALHREIFADLHGNRGRDVEGTPWARQLRGVIDANADWQESRIACSGRREIASRAADRIAQAVAGIVGLDSLPDETAENETARGEAMSRAIERAARSGKLGSAISDVAREATERGEIAALLVGCGEESRDDEAIDVDTVDTLRGDPMIREILDLAGRLVSRGKQDQKIGTRGEICGVTVGGDVDNLLPSVLGQLACGGLAALASMGEIAEHRALSWERKMPSPAGGGDVVVAVDQSGSMSHRDRYRFARAVSIALVSLAVQRGRMAAVVGFDFDARSHVVRGQSDLAAAISLLCRAPSGGTRIETAVAEAQAVSSQLRDPDLVVITDGIVSSPVDLSAFSARTFAVGIDVDVAHAFPGATSTRTVAATTQEGLDLIGEIG